MHELSLAMNVIGLASAEAEKNNVNRIFSIEIEIGELSGVEPEAFRFSLEILAADSVLKNSEIRFLTAEGRGKCKKCGNEFRMTEITQACPGCGEYNPEILRGREFRLKSLTGE